MVRRAQPTLREMGAFYLDSAPLRGYADLTARVTILTLMPASFSFDRLPALLQNSRMMRRRLGFLQHYCRFTVRTRQAASTASTTVTTTAMQTNCNRGAGAISIYDKLVRFFIASPRGHCESGTLRGSLPVEDVLAQLGVQLADAHELWDGLTVCASDRIVSDFDQGFSVFVNVHDPRRCEFAWIDARRFGQAPFTVALPFEVTEDALLSVCSVPIPSRAHVAISGAPWRGLPVRLHHGDIVVLGFRKHHLWTIPLAAMERRVEGISALLVPHNGPSPGARIIAFQYETRSGSSRRAYDFQVLRVLWTCIRLDWQDKTGTTREPGADYQRCVLIATDIPPFPVAPAVRTAPAANDVNFWYTHRVSRIWGQRRWKDAGLAFGDLTVFYDSRLDAASRRPWIVCIGEDLDVLIAGTEGEGLDNWPAPEGWGLRPVFTAGPIGQAALQRLTAEPNPVFHQDPPGGPVIDVSSASSDDDPAHVQTVTVPPSPDPTRTYLQSLIDHPPTLEEALQQAEAEFNGDDEPSLLQVGVLLKRSTAAKEDGVEETTPRTEMLRSVRRIPTPCGNTVNRTLRSTTSLSQARASKSVEQSDCVEAVDAPPAELVVPIRLQDCVPPPKLPALVPASMRTEARLEDLLVLTAPHALPSFRRDLLQLPEVHPRTRDLLATMPVWDGCTVTSVTRLHVDGSFVDATGSGGWAVIATVLVQSQWQWVGWKSDCLYGPGHSYHCAQTEVNPHTAELVALLHAYATAVTVPGVECQIWFDSTSAASVAAGTAFSKRQGTIAQAMIALKVIADTLLPQLSFHHVKSHEGDPLNEAADTVAKAAAKYGITHNANGHLFAAAVRDHKFHWLWWTVTAHVPSGVLPGLNDQGDVVDATVVSPCVHSLRAVPGIPRPLAQSASFSSSLATWKIRAVTCNCTTLVREHDRQSLAKSFGQDSVHLVGLQETRTDPGPRSHVPGYAVLSAPADKGNLGCQLDSGSILKLQ